MNKIEPTKEELLATLRHSSLPTVLIEGDDDIIFIEGRTRILMISI